MAPFSLPMCTNCNAQHWHEISVLGIWVAGDWDKESACDVSMLKKVFVWILERRHVFACGAVRACNAQPVRTGTASAYLCVVRWRAQSSGKAKLLS